MVKLEPEEVQAIVSAMQPAPGAARPHGSVVPRDFQKPRRLSPAQLAELRKRVIEGLGPLRDALKSMLRSDVKVKLLEVDEVSCEGLFDALATPPLLMQFEIRRQPGWIVWDPSAALTALESVLGQSPGAAEGARAFTPIEALMLQRLLTGAAAAMLRCLQLEPGPASMVRDPALVASWRDGGPEADPQRLLLAVELEGPGGTSTLRIYAPSPLVKEEVAKAGPKPALPGHLGDVRIGVAARLAQIDVPLAQLLEIEVGDVIPLRVPLGSQLDVVVEDQRCMVAALGQCQGKLAVRIHAVEKPKSEA